MRTATWIFRIAGVWGLIAVTPLFFADTATLAAPVPYYGFAGLALAFQLLFLLVSTDPVRYRPVMLVCVFEKLAALPFIFLYVAGRGEAPFFYGGLIDQVLAVAFLTAYLMTPRTYPGAGR